VDIDATSHYLSIHGLDTGKSAATDPVWTHGVSRFLTLFQELELKATFFVVASDLVSVQDGGAAFDDEVVEFRRNLVRKMVQKGHEVASHSFSHEYTLSQLEPEVILEDLLRARVVLEETTGTPVVGFRAPGYNLSKAMIDAIQKSGATYSSSRFPSPPYFFAKWMVMAKSAVQRKPSGSIVGELAAPFRTRKAYRHKNGLLELPMSVVPVLRLPVIGTFFTLYGEKGRKVLQPIANSQDWLNVEFHGIDLVDPADPGLDPRLLRSQPDLKTEAMEKRALFSSWLEGLSAGREQKTLACFATDHVASD